MPNDVVELLVQRLDTGEMLRLRGREAWTLSCLLETGRSGVIPLERPAPRWSIFRDTRALHLADALTGAQGCLRPTEASCSLTSQHQTAVPDSEKPSSRGLCLGCTSLINLQNGRP
jgi:hypothetical protein